MSAKPHKLYPHGEFRSLAPNLWIVRGGMPMPIYRNMVVYRLPDGRLILHSLIALDEAGVKRLETLGKPSFMLVPHGYDSMDVPWYFQRYPQATFLTPDEERSRVEECGVKMSDDPARVLPSFGIKLHKVVGLKFTEYVLEAPVDGGTAVICNGALANNGAAAPGFFGWLMDMATMSGGKLTPGRALRTFMVQDKAAFKGFLTTLPAIPNIKILTVTHGDPIVGGDIAAKLRETISG